MPMMSDLADQRDAQHARRDLDVEVRQADDEADAYERQPQPVHVHVVLRSLAWRNDENPPSSATPKIA